MSVIEWASRVRGVINSALGVGCLIKEHEPMYPRHGKRKMYLLKGSNA